MDGTMLAARAHEGERRLKVEEVPIPRLDEGDVLVRVRSSGITRGLLHLWLNLRQVQLLPATLGMQIAGTIAEIGPGAQGWAEGDRVMVQPGLYCGHCRYCLDGNEPDCPTASNIGHAVYNEQALPMYERYHDGGLAEYVKVPTWSAIRLPDRASFPVGGRISGAGVSYRSLGRAGLEIGDTVVITGATGAYGAAAVKCAPLHGATRIIAVSRSREGLERIKALEPERVEVVALDELPDGWEEKGALTEEIVARNDGRPVDAVVDFLPPGAHPQITLQSVYALRKRGTAVITGGNAAALTIPYPRLMVNCWTVCGSRGARAADSRRLLELIDIGALDLEPLITHTFPLERVNEAIDLIEERSEPALFVAVEP